MKFFVGIFIMPILFFSIVHGAIAADDCLGAYENLERWAEGKTRTKNGPTFDEVSRGSKKASSRDLSAADKKAYDAWIAKNPPPSEGLVGASGKKYKTVGMERDWDEDHALKGLQKIGIKSNPYRFENILGSDPSYGFYKVQYLKPAEQNAREVFVLNGNLVWRNGEPIDTSAMSSGGLFVMDQTGRIFLSTYEKLHEFHHSSLAAGKRVAAAGEIKVINGKIEFVNNSSGHYLPPTSTVESFLSELKSRGVDISGIQAAVF